MASAAFQNDAVSTYEVATSGLADAPLQDGVSYGTARDRSDFNPATRQLLGHADRYREHRRDLALLQ